MMPQKVATSRPRLRLNSPMEARFCSSDNSRSLEIPAAQANAIPVMQITTPNRITMPECVPSTCFENSPRKIGGSRVTEGRRIPERHSHAERQAQVSHGQAEGEAAQAPQHAKGKGASGSLAQDGEQVARCPAPVR